MNKIIIFIAYLLLNQTQEINPSPVKKHGTNDDHQQSDQINARALQNEDNDHQQIDQINANALQNEDDDHQQQAKCSIFAANPLIGDQQWAEPVVHSESASNQFSFEDLLDPVGLETEQDWNEYMTPFYHQSSAIDQNVDLALQSDQHMTPFYHQSSALDTNQSMAQQMGQHVMPFYQQSSAFDQNQSMAQQMDQLMMPNYQKSSAIDQNQRTQQRHEHMTSFYQQSSAIDQNKSMVQPRGRMLMRQTSQLSANDRYLNMAQQRDRMQMPSTSKSNAIMQNQSMSHQNDHLVPRTINQSNAADNNPSTSNTQKCQFSRDAIKTKDEQLSLKPVNCHNDKQQKGKTIKDPIKTERPVEKREQKRHKKAEDQTDVEQLDMGSYLTVVAIQQIFWRVMWSFRALPEHLNEQQIEQIIKDLIDPKMAEKIKEKLRQLLLIDNCLVDKQSFWRINHEISFVFGSPLFNNNNLHDENNDEETHEKLLLFTIRLLRILLGFLDAPYERFENKENRKKSDRTTLTIVIYKARKEFMKAFSNSIKNNYAKKMYLMAKFEMLETILEIIDLAIFGIEVIVAPLIGQELFKFDNYMATNESFSKLAQIMTENNLTKILEKRKEKLNLAHLVEEVKTYRQIPYFKNRLGIFLQFNLILDEVVNEPKTNDEFSQGDSVQIGQIYKEIFGKILKYFQPNFVEFMKDRPDLLHKWHTMENFMKECIKQFEEN